MQTIEEMEQHIVKLDNVIKIRDAILRLSKNRDFKLVIEDEFMVQECARYTHNSGNPGMTADQRQDSLNIAQSAGHLKRFLSAMIQMGNQAENDKGGTQEAIEEMRAEGSAD